MSTLALTVYVLGLPLIVAGVLWVIVSAYIREWRQARRDGSDII